MKTNPTEIRIRKVFDAILREGSYHDGYIRIIEEIIEAEKAEITDGIKNLLNIDDCRCNE